MQISEIPGDSHSKGFKDIKCYDSVQQDNQIQVKCKAPVIGGFMQFLCLEFFFLHSALLHPKVIVQNEWIGQLQSIWPKKEIEWGPPIL